MAKRSIKDMLLGILRQWSLGYRASRGLWRGIRRGYFAVARQILPYPKGTFSLFEAVEEGQVEGHIYFTHQDVPDFPSESLVKRSGLHQDGFQPWPVFRARIDNARLSGPNLLLIDERKQACAEGMHTADFRDFDASYNRMVRGAVQTLEGNWTSIVGRLDQGYWHFLFDAVTRLHALPELPEDTRILIRPNPAPWQLEIFEMMDVRDRVVEAPGTQLEIEHFHFLSFTSMTGAWNPFGVEYLRRTFLPSAKPVHSGEKLYLRRTAGWTRGVINDEEVCDFLVSKGWKVVNPESLSVAEQMGLFQQAEAVCSVHGSALTNLLWCSPPCKVVEICADNFLLGSFEWLAHCLGLEHCALVFPGNAQYAVKVDLQQLGQAIDNMERK